MGPVEGYRNIRPVNIAVARPNEPLQM